MARKPGRHALLFILITVFIDIVGIGIIIPVTPALIMELTGESASLAAYYGGWLLFLYSGMQFFLAPAVGNLSDRFGRRPILLFSLLGFGINYAVAGAAGSLFWLFFGRLMSGMFGATYTTANAYIADVTAPEKRAAAFGLLGAAFGVGFIFGPLIGGLAGEIHHRLPFFIAAGLALANLVYGYFVLPETLAPENRRRFDWRRANPVGGLIALRRHPGVLALAAALFVYYFSHQSMHAVWTFFTIERFGWSAAQIGWSLAAIGLAAALVQGGLTRVIVPKLGEGGAAMIGLFFAALAGFGFAAAAAGWQLYLVIAVGGLAALAAPSARGLASRLTPADAQGELQGALTSVQGLAAFIGPLLMTGLFRAFSAPYAPVYFPGAPFALSGVLALVALAIVALAARAGRRAKPAAADRPEQSREGAVPPQSL